jgi:plasmid stabilization system protein ParE
VKRRVIFTPLAESDFVEALDWYTARSSRIGDRFADAVLELRDMIADNPLQYARLRGDVRRGFVHGFPYMLVYRISGDEAHVLGCFHTSRNPRVWRRRLAH